MKKTIILMALVLTSAVPLFAQNIFPPSGNAGIGTASPAAPLHMLNYNRNYYVNRFIAYSTADGTGKDYILLHPCYNNDTIPDYYVMGKIHAVRGSDASYNRKFSIEVNTGSAYLTNTGSIISYNEHAGLVTLTYNGVKYLAVEIGNQASLYNLMFTGHAYSATLTLVHTPDVTGVTAFIPNPITISGAVAIGGTSSPGNAKLAVEGTIAARKVKVQQTGWPDFVFADEYNLPALDSVEKFVRTNKHLPGIPSEADIKKDGLDLGDMNAKLLQKIEELTLYMIEVKKENAEMKERLRKLENK